MARDNAKKPRILVSHSGRDKFEASLLQYVIESTCAEHRAVAWTYERDQSRCEKNIAGSLKAGVRESVAVIFLVSPDTVQSGSTQWMELAYADAFGVPTFILLHHLQFDDLKRREGGVPPLLLSSQCNPATEWMNVVNNIKDLLDAQTHHA